MIALYSHRPVYLLLGRSLNTASTLIQPHITAKHREIIESCCTIEVTTDRLSYASLCLDPENKNSIILSSWNSLSLNLPSGKEFRPYMCSSMFKATTQRLVHDICSSGKLTSSQFALVYVSSKLSSASLAYNCSNIIKDNILCSNYLGASTDVILRPIAPLSTSSFTTIHSLDIRNVHQAVIMGYLLAFLSSNINNTPTSQLCISTNCPSIETLVKWTNQSTNRWTTYLSHQMFKNQSNITFSLLPVKSNHLTNISAPTKTIHSNNDNDSSDIIQIRVESSQLFSIYKCFNSKNHEHISTVQFLLARCLFTCMYHLLKDRYSMMV
ncbi:unnamed protein product [Schistosoma mattheei]|uniref:Uncharacterized protein n=1 Tax=Schistosoma mattheei TaxID=31246 RepID=A0AA85BFX3_9TREM|nr:unnamed protein product [Schistosoma mattheei]